jgi:hypothetical protein
MPEFSRLTLGPCLQADEMVAQSRGRKQTEGLPEGANTTTTFAYDALREQ